MKGLQKRKKTWYIDVTVDGKRLTGSTKCTDKKEAEKVLVQKVAEFKANLELVASRAGQRLFSDAVVDAKKKLWGANRTLAEASKKCDLLIELLGDPDIRDIKVRDLSDLRDKLRDGVGGKAPRAERTVTKYMNTITTILNHEISLENIQSFPRIKNVKVVSHKRILTAEEINDLFSYFEARDPDFADTCKVLLDTGFRTGELSQLKGCHVDFTSSSICLSRGIKLKGKLARTITMTPRVIAIMERRITNAEAHVFPYTTSDNYKQRWKRWRRTQPGGEEDAALTPHALRHTCCTRLLTACKDIFVVQQWMGHQSTTTTQEYLKLIPGQLQNAAAMLHEFNEALANGLTSQDK